MIRNAFTDDMASAMRPDQALRQQMQPETGMQTNANGMLAQAGQVTPMAGTPGTGGAVANSSTAPAGSGTPPPDEAMGPGRWVYDPTKGKTIWLPVNGNA